MDRVVRAYVRCRQWCAQLVEQSPMIRMSWLHAIAVTKSEEGKLLCRRVTVHSSWNSQEYSNCVWLNRRVFQCSAASDGSGVQYPCLYILLKPEFLRWLRRSWRPGRSQTERPGSAFCMRTSLFPRVKTSHKEHINTINDVVGKDFTPLNCPFSSKMIPIHLDRDCSMCLGKTETN